MKIKDAIPPLHQEGYIFVICSAAFAFLAGAAIPTVGWICAFITIFIACFFRDPQRVSPEGDDVIVSPADGTIDKIEEALAPEELGKDKATYKRVSIFLSVFNVHVNRVPASGTITDLHYRKGSFVSASLDKASSENERQICAVQMKSGEKIVFVQIAGLIARRIVCYLNEKQEVKAGESFGIIRFGSRADIYLPKDAELNVIEGQTMIGGETVIARLKSKSSSKKVAPKAKK